VKNGGGGGKGDLFPFQGEQEEEGTWRGVSRQLVLTLAKSLGKNERDGSLDSGSDWRRKNSEKEKKCLKGALCFPKNAKRKTGGNSLLVPRKQARGRGKKEYGPKNERTRGCKVASGSNQKPTFWGGKKKREDMQCSW